jgi:DNA polymerase-3 subunit epsilon
MPAVELWPDVPPCSRVAERSSGRLPRRETYISTLLDRLGASVGFQDGATHAYLELLDRALEDRRLTATEADDLAELASDWGIGQATCRQLHDAYMGALVSAAWNDGVVTEAERADLEDVAALLKIDEPVLKAMLDAPFVDGGPVSLPAASDGFIGKSVCFTGQLTCTIKGKPISRADAQALAIERGLLVKPSVTKKLDLLVVADPDTLSGKAQKAREYGTRIVVERTFWRSLGVPVD